MTAQEKLIQFIHNLTNEEADLIILSMGSVFTSIIPNLICDEIIQAIDRSKGKIMYVCNMVTQPGETDGFKVSDHVKLLNQYLGKHKLDVVVANSGQIDDEMATRVVSMEVIQQRVAEQFGITMADLMGNRRPRNIAEPRMVAMYLCRRHTRHSLPEIGNAFGKTHATVLNAMNKVPELCRKDDALRTRMRQIEKSLGRKGGF